MPRGIYPEEIKQQAVKLRRKGFTYSEIPKMLNYSIPKNTFSGWFKHINLSKKAKRRIMDKIREGGAPGRVKAWKNIQQRRIVLLQSIHNRIDDEIKAVDKLTAKICLAMLYLGEGGKYGELFRFCNSDPKIIKLFLELLRRSFNIEEARLRGELKCRADQNVKYLEAYWSKITEIPLSSFYKAQKDPRTLGIPTKRINYKGVFTVYYSSKALFFEVKFISDIIYNRLLQ